MRMVTVQGDVTSISVRIDLIQATALNFYKTSDGRDAHEVLIQSDTKSHSAMFTSKDAAQTAFEKLRQDIAKAIRFYHIKDQGSFDLMAVTTVSVSSGNGYCNLNVRIGVPNANKYGNGDTIQQYKMESLEVAKAIVNDVNKQLDLLQGVRTLEPKVDIAAMLRKADEP